MATPRLLMLTLAVSLAGCGAIDNFRLNSAMQRYKNVCTNDTTIDCDTQLVDMNILMLKHLRRTANDEQSELVSVSGDLGYSAVITAIDDQLKRQESLKPNPFVAWFVPDKLGTGKHANASITPEFYTQLKVKAVKAYETAQEMAALDYNSPYNGQWQALSSMLGTAIWPQ